MAEQKFTVDINLDQNELLKARVENQTTSNIPTSPKIGQIYYDTDLEQMGIFTSTNGWIYFLSGSSGYVQSILAPQTSIDIAMNGNVATITITNATQTEDGFMSKEDKIKLDNATNTNTVSTLVERDATGIINVTQVLLTDEPTLAKHAATKGYVDNIAQGLKTKLPARVISKSNIDLTTGGLLTIDSVPLIAGDRVLVVGQTSAAENGIYIVESGAWTRSDDLKVGDNAANVYLFVGEGTVEADTGWVCTSDKGSDVIGTDDIEFVKFSSAGVIEAGAGLTKVGNMINAMAGDNSLTINPDDMIVNIDPAGSITVTPDGLKVNTDGTHIKIDGNQITIGDSVSKTVYKSVTLTGGTPLTINHNLNTRNLHTTVIDQTTFEQYITRVVHTDANNISVSSNSTENVIVIISGNIGISL